MAGAGSSSQFIGGLVVGLLYLVIGLLSAIGTILIVRQSFQGRWEQIFWASFLVVIAAFYLSFAAYFGASPHAWQTEVVGVAVFLVCAVCGLFFRPAIAVVYVMHGLWDLSHSLSGSSLAGLSITDIPLGYGIFCATYDLLSRVTSLEVTPHGTSRGSSTFTSGDMACDTRIAALAARPCRRGDRMKRRAACAPAIKLVCNVGGNGKWTYQRVSV